MSGLFKTPKIPKPQPTVTPQDAAITSMEEALRLRRRRGRLSTMLFGRRKGSLGSGTAAGILGTSPGGVGGAPGGGGGSDGGVGGGGGGGGGGRPVNPSY